MSFDLPPAQPARVILSRGLAEVAEERSRRFAECRERLERATAERAIVECTERTDCGCALHARREEKTS